MKRHTWLANVSVLFVTAGALLGACADPAAVSLPGEVHSSTLERERTPAVPAADQAALVQGNTAFALDAYQELRQSEGNLFYSPLSISVAMAMTYGGARADTETEMAAALHYDLPQERLHPAMNWLDLELDSRGEGAQGADGEPFRLAVANATFGQQGFAFLPAYLDLLAVNYGAAMSLMDFISRPEQSRQAINDWVSYQTEERIPRLLPQGFIDDNTRLVLTNAVYFNAAWKTPFDPERTADGTFQAPGGEVTVPMMSGEVSMQYATGEGYQAVSLPYSGDQLDMVIIMPDAGSLDAFEASLDQATLASILDGLGASPYGELRMPAFEFRFQASLVDMFQQLGLTAAFDAGAADFSGMNGERSLQITGIVHEAFVKVNEAGTEAAAATGVGVGTTSAPQVLSIDRPFVFAIRDIPTSSIVFLGRVVDPS